MLPKMDESIVGKRIVSIDYGTRRMGISVGVLQPSGRILEEILDTPNILVSPLPSVDQLGRRYDCKSHVRAAANVWPWLTKYADDMDRGGTKLTYDDYVVEAKEHFDNLELDRLNATRSLDALCKRYRKQQQHQVDAEASSSKNDGPVPGSLSNSVLDLFLGNSSELSVSPSSGSSNSGVVLSSSNNNTHVGEAQVAPPPNLDKVVFAKSRGMKLPPVTREQLTDAVQRVLSLTRYMTDLEHCEVSFDYDTAKLHCKIPPYSQRRAFFLMVPFFGRRWNVDKQLAQDVRVMGRAANAQLMAATRPYVEYICRTLGDVHILVMEYQAPEVGVAAAIASSGLASGLVGMFARFNPNQVEPRLVSYSGLLKLRVFPLTYDEQIDVRVAMGRTNFDAYWLDKPMTARPVYDLHVEPLTTAFRTSAVWIARKALEVSKRAPSTLKWYPPTSEEVKQLVAEAAGRNAAKKAKRQQEGADNTAVMDVDLPPVKVKEEEEDQLAPPPTKRPCPAPKTKPASSQPPSIKPEVICIDLDESDDMPVIINLSAAAAGKDKDKKPTGTKRAASIKTKSATATPAEVAAIASPPAGKEKKRKGKRPWPGSGNKVYYYGGASKETDMRRELNKRSAVERTDLIMSRSDGRLLHGNVIAWSVRYFHCYGPELKRDMADAFLQMVHYMYTHSLLSDGTS